MQLRNRNKPIGFYAEVKKSTIEENNSSQSSEIRRPLEMGELIRRISFLIIKQIKKPKSQITIRLDISNKLKMYFQKKYNLTKRFQHIPNFLNEDIRTSISTNDNVRNEIISETFKIKFANEKKLKFTENDKEIVMTYPPEIVIDFKKKRKFTINQNMRNLLNNI